MRVFCDKDEVEQEPGKEECEPQDTKCNDDVQKVAGSFKHRNLGEEISITFSILSQKHNSFLVAKSEVY